MALMELIKEMERQILDSRDPNQRETTDHNGGGEDTREAAGAASGAAAEDIFPVTKCRS